MFFDLTGALGDAVDPRFTELGFGRSGSRVGKETEADGEGEREGWGEEEREPRHLILAFGSEMVEREQPPWSSKPPSVATARSRKTTDMVSLPAP